LNDGLARLAMLARWFVSQRPESSQEQCAIHDPKHVRIVIFIAMIGMLPVVANIGNHQEDDHLALRLAKVPGAFPVLKKEGLIIIG
jgi:hypothetical protein